MCTVRTCEHGIVCVCVYVCAIPERFLAYQEANTMAALLIDEDVETVNEATRQFGTGIVTSGPKWRALVKTSLASCLGAMAAFKQASLTKFNKESRMRLEHDKALVKAAKAGKKPPRKPRLPKSPSRSKRRSGKPKLTVEEKAANLAARQAKSLELKESMLSSVEKTAATAKAAKSAAAAASASNLSQASDEWVERPSQTNPAVEDQSAPSDRSLRPRRKAAEPKEPVVDNVIAIVDDDGFSLATDPDFMVDQVIAVAGKADDMSGTPCVHLILVTDITRARQGTLEGVYLQAVDNNGVGLYERAHDDNGLWCVDMYDSTAEEPLEDSARVSLADILCCVDFESVEGVPHTSWTEDSEVAHTEWEHLQTELSSYLSGR